MWARSETLPQSLNRLSALSSLGTGIGPRIGIPNNFVKSQSPFGFKFTRNFQKADPEKQGAILSQSPFGFKFTRNNAFARLLSAKGC